MKGVFARFGFASQTAKSFPLQNYDKSQLLKYMFYINIDNKNFILVNINLCKLVIIDPLISYCVLLT